MMQQRTGQPAGARSRAGGCRAAAAAAAAAAPAAARTAGARRRRQGAWCARCRRDGDDRVGRAQGARRSARATASRGPRSSSTCRADEVRLRACSLRTCIRRLTVSCRPHAASAIAAMSSAHRHLQVPLPGLRRAGGVESGQGAARVPVLRHRGAVRVQARHRPDQELDLEGAARATDDQRGWQAEKRSVQCHSCKAVMVFDPTRVGQNCEFCGSPALVDYDGDQGADPPASLLPFRGEAQVRDRCASGSRASGWRRQAQAQALVDTCTASTSRTGRSTRVCTARGAPRRATTTTRRDVPRQPGPNANAPGAARALGERPGTSTHFFDDNCARHQGVRHDLLTEDRAVPDAGPGAVRRRYALGLVVEQYQIVLFDAAERSIQQMRGALQAMCAQEMPGDTYRNLEMSPTCSARTFKHVLVPCG